MKHTCHWPTCEQEVPPKMWGCRKHWFTLPQNLRSEIWRTYRPGQEITKDPSDEYTAVAILVQAWCVNHIWFNGDMFEKEQVKHKLLRFCQLMDVEIPEGLEEACNE